MWLPVFALCTPLGAPLFVSVTVVRGVSPQAVRRRAYRELGKIRLIRPIRLIRFLGGWRVRELL